MSGAIPLAEFIQQLAAKQPTPGGGGAAAAGGALGAAAAHMAAIYTTRKKDVESGAAEKATALMSTLDSQALLAVADDDAAAYADLQRTWKAPDMPATEKAAIEAKALQVPVALVERCAAQVAAIEAFLPDCNPNITSDAKVGVHLLAGAARSAYQTALVNSPPPETLERLRSLLREVRGAEDRLLGLGEGEQR
uniref:Cyclodeaminase/cyclohydrolase domain-containing protein n=1 Tax=Alexandrium catenella TaxID=2925 RepID=A0A7S1WGN5_ALECA